MHGVACGLGDGLRLERKSNIVFDVWNMEKTGTVDFLVLLLSSFLLFSVSYRHLILKM